MTVVVAAVEVFPVVPLPAVGFTVSVTMREKVSAPAEDGAVNDGVADVGSSSTTGVPPVWVHW